MTHNEMISTCLKATFAEFLEVHETAVPDDFNITGSFDKLDILKFEGKLFLTYYDATAEESRQQIGFIPLDVYKSEYRNVAPRPDVYMITGFTASANPGILEGVFSDFKTVPLSFLGEELVDRFLDHADLGSYWLSPLSIPKDVIATLASAQHPNLMKLNKQ